MTFEEWWRDHRPADFIDSDRHPAQVGWLAREHSIEIAQPVMDTKPVCLHGWNKPHSHYTYKRDHSLTQHHCKGPK